MRLLLDTHAYVWFRNLDGRLPPSLRGKIESAAEAFVSHVSLWELAIQASLGRIRSVDRFFDGLDDAGLVALELKTAHIARYRHNPLHHRDPFDRMIVAQAQVEELVLVSVDSAIAAYDVQILTN